MKRRYWPRRFMLGQGCGVLASLILGVGLAFLVIHAVNLRLRPVLLDMALTQASNRVTAAVNEAVAAQTLEYADLITLERDGSGNIIALTSNMSAANQLRTQLLTAALSAVEGVDIREMRVPIGTLSGIDLLSGRGPRLRVDTVSVGAARAEFENEFTEAGINQTLHQLYWNVSVDLSILLPGESCQSTVSTKVCVAETVIVGKVPETYLQLGGITQNGSQTGSGTAAQPARYP